ncbi:hypothetical protein EON65_23875 [archaeon]|nr:MAG: hypothetical protein EON65_23875 [archaeon]
MEDNSLLNRSRTNKKDDADSVYSLFYDRIEVGTTLGKQLSDNRVSKLRNTNVLKMTSDKGSEYMDVIPDTGVNQAPRSARYKYSKSRVVPEDDSLVPLTERRLS